ncbi:hypothetical protein CsSME_00048786 [Camellia sinensis var. sinensis]
MHVSGFPLDLNWFLQFIVTAFIIAFGLLHLVKNTASKYFMVDANFDSPDPSSSPPPLGRGGGEGRKMPRVSATAADSCVVCGNSTTKQCSGCKLVRYCSGACQTSHWKSGHKTKCKDFQLSGQVKSMQSAYMQHGRRDSSAVALVPSSGTINIIKQSKEYAFWLGRTPVMCTALLMWFYNVLCTLGPLLPTCWRKAIGKNADGMIGASFVNFKPMLKDPVKVGIPFHQLIFSRGYLILVVTLAMENKRMRMSS